MSYGPKPHDKNLFHRMAEEMYRMAEAEVELDKADIDLLIESVNHIAATMDYDTLTCQTLTVAACLNGDMDACLYLGDAKAELVYTLMHDGGYEYIIGDDHALFVKTL